MSVHVTPVKGRPGHHQVHIYFRWPDNTPYRERPKVKMTAAQAKLWGEQRERLLFVQGPPRSKQETEAERRGAVNVAKWFEALHARKEVLGLGTVKDMRGRAKNWILPLIGALSMAEVTREHIEKIVRRLDAEIIVWTNAKAKRGCGISPATARNIWGDLVHAFNEAVTSKDPALRALDVSPCEKVQGPESGSKRQGQILYGDELLLLLGGKAIDPGSGAKDVPPYRRRVYAGAVYMMTRASELAAVTARDVDVQHQTVSIVKQVVRTKKTLTKGTKTKRSRTIDIEPNLWPLLEQLMARPEGEEGRLFRVPPLEDCAEKLRRDLWAVGVRRPELHESDASRKQQDFHALRDTGLTMMAIRGDRPIAIQWRGGHTDWKTTQGYLDRGQVEGRRVGVTLGPLPASVLLEPPPSEGVQTTVQTARAKVETEVGHGTRLALHCTSIAN